MKFVSLQRKFQTAQLQHTVFRGVRIVTK